MDWAADGGTSSPPARTPTIRRDLQLNVMLLLTSLLPFTTVCGEAQLVSRDLPSFLHAVTADLDYREPTTATVGFLRPAEGVRLKCLGRPRADVMDHRASRARFVLPATVPLPLLVTAAIPRLKLVAGSGGAGGVAYVMLIVQVAPGASVAPQVVPVKLNNVFEIPATVVPASVTGVGALAVVPWFVIVTTLVTEPRGAGINPKFRVRAPATVDSVALVAAVKANGPAATPVPERLTVPVTGPVSAV